MLNVLGLICVFYLCYRYQKWEYNKYIWPKQERMLERQAKRELEKVLIKRKII